MSAFARASVSLITAPQGPAMHHLSSCSRPPLNARIRILPLNLLTQQHWSSQSPHFNATDLAHSAHSETQKFSQSPHPTTAQTRQIPTQTHLATGRLVLAGGCYGDGDVLAPGQNLVLECIELRRRDLPHRHRHAPARLSKCRKWKK